MGRTRKLLTNTILFTISNGFNKFIGLMLLPIYTNFFSANALGIYDLFSTYSLFLYPIISFQVFEAFFYYNFEKNNSFKNKLDFLKNSNTIVLIGLALFSLFVLIFNSFSYKISILFYFFIL